MRETLSRLKAANEDFEWYPTTKEMISAVVSHVRHSSYSAPESILDIGAGDGRVLTALAEAFDASPQLYAIEKANAHLEAMPPQIAIVGTDFHRQTLIDKRVDLVFCNPPYSEFEAWAVKVIKEAACNSAYLVIPQRWTESKLIQQAMQQRGVSATVIWSGDFLTADRRARAKVNVLHIRMELRWRETERKDPFDLWFDEMFPEVERLRETVEEKPSIKTEAPLVSGQNLIERLANLYARDLDKMGAAYRALCEIDPTILKTVGVEADAVRSGLQKKIAGLKDLYWRELFDHLDKITERLTSASREVILEKMAASVHVDFSTENAYAIIMWVLKNANHYIDSQLVDLFKELSNPESIRNYKSNQRTWGRDGWRFRNSDPHTHYMLDYRVVSEQYRAILRSSDTFGSWEYPQNLHKNCHRIIGDIVTVANNLGFECSFNTHSRSWSSGEAVPVYLNNGEILMRIRAFKNGNLHFQFNQAFIQRLNIEASRLLGWIRTPQEAVEEMGIDEETAVQAFRTNKTFAITESRLLLTA